MAKERRLGRLYPYFQAVPDIFRFQIVSTIVLAVILAVLKLCMESLVRSTGRVALSSGDFVFVFFTWQGILLIMAALLVLCLYVAFDLNMKIILAGKLLKGQEISIRGVLRECIAHIRDFMCPEGLSVVLYIALIAPVIGTGFSISLTKNLYIPTFITSVIHDTPLYQGIYDVFFLVFAMTGLMNVFCLHGVLLDGLSFRDSFRQSLQLMKKNWKNYIKETLLFSFRYACILLPAGILLFIIPLLLGAVLKPDAEGMQTAFLVSCALSALVVSAYTFFASAFYMMKTVQLYASYCKGETVYYQRREPQHRPVLALVSVLGLAAVIGICFAVSAVLDVLFPDRIEVNVIAHRGGGNEGPENTVSGMEQAYALGAYGSEIDIQRTADGYYVLNHDSTFARTAGVNRKPEEMTMEEIRGLSVNGEPVPTIEEMLEASRDKVILFVELKGNTADRRMADDMVSLLKDMHMEEQAVLISLKYDLVDYIETYYPEIQTGYLTFVSFGDTAALNCDYIGLEEEAATANTINAIHDQNKKVLVWTANDAGSQRHFLRSDVDGMITDNVAQAFGLIDELENRTDIEKIVDLFFAD